MEDFGSLLRFGVSLALVQLPHCMEKPNVFVASHSNFSIRCASNNGGGNMFSVLSAGGETYHFRLTDSNRAQTHFLHNTLKIENGNIMLPETAISRNWATII
jgi:hypothetical protein